MKICVLGATGVTGGLYVETALGAQDTVTAVVRSPGAIVPRAGLTVVPGDVVNTDALGSAMAGADAVVSLLGLRSGKPNGFSERAVSSIVAAAERSGVGRVLVMSAFGVGPSAEKASTLARLMYKTGAKAIYADKAAGERVLTSSSLTWTLAYPVLLTDGRTAGGLRAIDLDRLDRLSGLPKVARGDVADFLHSAITDERWFRRTAVLTNGRVGTTR